MDLNNQFNNISNSLRILRDKINEETKNLSDIETFQLRTSIRMLMPDTISDVIQFISTSEPDKTAIKEFDNVISAEETATTSKHERKARITPSELIEICKSLVNNNGNLDKTLDELESKGIKYNKFSLREIRNKKIYTHVSDKYFQLVNVKKYVSENNFQPIVTVEQTEKPEEKTEEKQEEVVTTTSKDSWAEMRLRIIEQKRATTKALMIDDMEFLIKYTSRKIKSSDVEKLRKELMKYNIGKKTIVNVIEGKINNYPESMWKE